MRIILLIFPLLLNFYGALGQSNKACVLTKSFETEWMTVAYTDNWNRFTFQDMNSLLYYEEANIDRREDAEIIFTSIPLSDGISIDTSDLASTFVREKLADLKNDPKYADLQIDLKISDETLERIKSATWHKVTATISGNLDKGEFREFRNVYYFNYRPSIIYAIVLNMKMPAIKTVDREFQCIFENLAFRK
jgi:hypothetical protein